MALTPSKTRVVLDRGATYYTIFGPVNSTTGPVTENFTLGKTRPADSNTGAGIIRVRPNPVDDVYSGPRIITVAGTTITDKWIPYGITVRAANVTIENCVITGTADGKADPADTGGGIGLVLAISNSCVNLKVRFCDLAAAKSTTLWNGILGWHFTSYRNKITKTVDGLGIYSPASGSDLPAGTPAVAVDCVVEGNWMYGLGYYSPDPAHSDNQTHNDVIQIQGGKNIRIVGNTLDAYFDQNVGTYPTNGPDPRALATIQITPNNRIGPIQGLVITDNWLNGGGISVSGTSSATQIFKSTSELTCLRNRFDRGQKFGSGNTTTTITIHPEMTLNAGQGTVDKNYYLDFPATDSGPEVLVRRATS